VVVGLTGMATEVTVTVAVAPDASVPLEGALSVNVDPVGSVALHVIDAVLLFFIETGSEPPEVPHETMLKSTCAGVTLTTEPVVPVPERLTFAFGMGWQRIVVALTPKTAVPV